MPDDVAKVARKLTMAQIWALSSARRHLWIFPREVRPDVPWPVKAGLIDLGLIGFPWGRLTPLGLAVRAHLEGEAS